MVERLRKTPGFIPDLSLVAEIDSIVVGHILFYLTSVLLIHQNKGIGGELVKAGLKSTTKQGYRSVINEFNEV
ncbi:hypothetical protein BMS3Abin16_01855 [archaeon BMS3Abin16]|nr:hypothetical protein BMS3Abin16_01855 [archaeon BMS3Abin16]